MKERIQVMKKEGEEVEREQEGNGVMPVMFRASALSAFLPFSLGQPTL